MIKNIKPLQFILSISLSIILTIIISIFITTAQTSSDSYLKDDLQVKTSAKFNVGPNDTSKQVIINDSGNVGIGVTPGTTYKLDISGNVRMSNLTSCGKIYTDANGKLTCGTDASGVTSESDPTVTLSVKDGVSWSEISSIPSGFSDGVDNAGITSEVDPQVGSISSNYVPKWDGSALVTSMIQDNGSTVGINNAPQSNQMLYVNAGGLYYAIDAYSSTGIAAVRGQTNSGRGIYGTAGTTGTGVYGASSQGYSGYFNGGKGILIYSDTTNYNVSSGGSCSESDWGTIRRISSSFYNNGTYKGLATCVYSFDGEYYSWKWNILD